MRTEFRRSFERDLRRVKKDREILDRIRAAIEEVEAADDLRELPNIKKLRGGSGDYYRLRVGDYRLGLEVELGGIENEVVVVFVRCLHRRDIYRYFP